MERRTLLAAVLTIVGLVLVGVATWALRPPTAIEISQQTTYIVSPTRGDGWVDYPEAVDWMRRAALDAGGENAAQPLLRALGPGMFLAGVDRAAVLRKLGVGEPSTPPLEPLRDLMAGAGATGQDPPPETMQWLQFRCRTRGKQPITFARIGQWLAQSDGALANLRAAARAASLYVPIARGPGRRDFGRLNPVALGDISDALGCRAAVKLLQGDAAASWDDVDALWKLGLLAARSASPGEYVVAASLWDKAMYGTVDLAMRAGTGADLLAAMEAAVKPQAFPPATESAMIHRLQALDNFATPLIVAPRSGQPAGTPVAANADVGRVLTILNAQFDAMDAALQFRDPRQRLARVEQVEAAAAQTFDAKSPLAPLALEVTQAGRPLLGAQTTAVSSQRLTLVALALAARQREKAALPASLAELGALPGDPGSGGSFIYKPTGRQFRLYGVGEDGRDDGGTTGNDVGVTAEPPPNIPAP